MPPKAVNFAELNAGVTGPFKVLIYASNPPVKCQSASKSTVCMRCHLNTSKARSFSAWSRQSETKWNETAAITKRGETWWIVGKVDKRAHVQTVALQMLGCQMRGAVREEALWRMKRQKFKPCQISTPTHLASLCRKFRQNRLIVSF